jgi:hypothetical protein
VLGARLRTFNILKIDQEECYEAQGPDGKQAIVAMIKEGNELPGVEVTRKRQRVDEGE